MGSDEPCGARGDMVPTACGCRDQRARDRDPRMSRVSMSLWGPERPRRNPGGSGERAQSPHRWSHGRCQTVQPMVLVAEEAQGPGQVHGAGGGAHTPGPGAHSSRLGLCCPRTCLKPLPLFSDRPRSPAGSCPAGSDQGSLPEAFTWSPGDGGSPGEGASQPLRPVTDPGAHSPPPPAEHGRGSCTLPARPVWGMERGPCPPAKVASPG